MLNPWYWEHYHYQVYAHLPYRLAVRKYTAPGRAKDVREIMLAHDLHPSLTAHDCLTLYNPRHVYAYLMHSAPSLLLEQALEDYLTTSKLTRSGKKVEPEARAQQEQSVRRVLACCPPWALEPGRPPPVKQRRYWRV